MITSQAAKLSTGARGKAALMVLLASLALAACNKEVVLEGTRFPIRAPLADSIPVEGQPAPVPPADAVPNQTLPIALPAAITNADWPQRGGSVRHFGPHGAMSAAPQLVWNVSIGAGNSKKNRISAAPVVAGGVVFVMDALSGVTAVSTQGAKLWHADLTAPFDNGGGVSGGGLGVEGSRLFATTGYGETIALNVADGTVMWRQRLGSMPAGAPAVAGNAVYVTGADGTAWALNAATGRILWQTTGASNVEPFRFEGGASAAVEGGMVVFPFSSGILLAVDAATGTEIWSAAVSGKRLGRSYATSGDVTGDPVLSGGVVYAGTGAGQTGAFAQTTGETLWTAGEGAMNPPLVVGGSVFVANDEGRLVRLNARDGQPIWAVDLPYFTKTKPKKRMEITASFGPVLAGGHLVVGSSDGQLRLFNPTDGSLAGQVSLPGGAATPPALAQGMLFIVNTKGQLLAFR